MEKKSLIDAQILQNSWNFVRQQIQQFDAWFGLCGLVLVFGLLVSCIIVMICIMIIAGLIMINPIILAAAGGTVSILSVLSIGILTLVLLSKSFFWSFGFFNAIAMNALDAAQGRPLRRFQNRITGFIYIIEPFLYFLIICIGLSFFVVPGIVFAVRFSLARYVLLDQGGTLSGAFMKSWDMTREHFWTLFLLQGALFILSLVSFVCLIDLFFPVSNLCTASLYTQLQSRKLTPKIVSV